MTLMPTYYQAYKTLNFHLKTPDNERLGAWFVFSEAFFEKSSVERPTSPPSDDVSVKAAIKEHPTVLFFHGARCTRCTDFNVAFCSMATSRLNANVLLIDYRGFGNSSGNPSEAGLNRDARTAWDWLAQHGATPDSVIIVGHSLGTTITTLLASQLANESASDGLCSLPRHITDTTRVH